MQGIIRVLGFFLFLNVISFLSALAQPVLSGLLLENTVTIPARDGPVLEFDDYCPDSLHFNVTSGNYEPYPFQLRFFCRNTGNSDAYDVTGTLNIPSSVEFMEGDSGRKQFTPSTIHPYQTGDSLAYVIWRLRPKSKYPKRTDMTADFRFTIGGMDGYGREIDSMDHWMMTRIPGVKPSLTCSLSPLPDSLVVDSTCRQYTDNPFTCRYIIYNTTWAPCSITNIQLNYSTSYGIALDPTSPTPQGLTLNQSLLHNDTASFEWKLRVLPRSDRRIIPISITALDDEGNPHTSSLSLTVAGMPEPIFASVRSSTTAVIYDSSLSEMTPADWVIETRLRNDCTYPRSNVRAELVLADSSMNFIQVDPNAPLNENPKHLDFIAPYDTWVLAWRLKIDSSKARCGTYKPVFRVRYTTDGSASQLNGKNENGWAVLRIVSSATDVPTAMPGQFSLGQNLPNPFNGTTVIQYEIPEAASVRLAVYDMLGKEVHSLVDSRREAGIHEAVFDASHLNPGVYFYRLEAGKQAATKMMVVVK